VVLDRKILADMAVSDPGVFAEVARLAGGAAVGLDAALP
jgi:ribosomal protein L20